MHLLTLLRRHTTPSLTWIGIAFIIIAGLELGLGITVTLAAEGPREAGWLARDIGVLLLGCLIFYICQSALMRHAMDGFVRALRAATEAAVKRTGHHETERGIADDDTAAAVSLLTDPAIPSALASSLVLAVQSLTLVLCGLVYLSTISKTACILALVILLVIMGTRTLGRWGLAQPYEAIRRHQRSAYRNLIALSACERRQALDPAARKGIEIRLIGDINAVAALHRSTHRDVAQDNAVQQVIYFMLLGGLIFVVPLVDASFQDEMLGAAAMTIYLFSPLSAALNNLPLYDAAEAAAGQLLSLGDRPLPSVGAANEFAEFSTLRLEGVRIDLPEQPEGSAVPLDLTIPRGGFVAIDGPAGSGKSLIADMLMGLGEPSEGRIWVDRILIGPATAPGLRSLFALAEENAPPQPVAAPPSSPAADILFDRLGLGARERTALHEPTRLSAAQRMHVAVAQAVLSDRPILVLDGVLDGADPAWRDNFLSTVLPTLTAAGRTVLLLTRQPDLARNADARLSLSAGGHHAGRDERTGQQTWSPPS